MKTFLPNLIFFWTTTSSVNDNTILLWTKEVKDNVCYRFSCQMYNWKLQHVNSPLNLWEIALWQRTILTTAIDRTLWSLRTSRSAVFLKMNICANKKKRTLVGIPSSFSNIIAWATRERRAIERSWHTQHLPDIGLGTLMGTVLTFIKTDNT